MWCLVQEEVYPNISGSRKEFAVFVEADRHDAVRGVECFFNTISMMDVNVDVQNSRMVSVLWCQLCYLKMYTSRHHRSNSNMPKTMSKALFSKNSTTPSQLGLPFT
jgi:hypothetical protein